MEEYFESIDEDEQNVPKSTPVSDIWLETVVIDVLFEVKSLSKHSPSYALVYESVMGYFMSVLRQHMYVRLIENHPKNPPVVPRLTNQL